MYRDVKKKLLSVVICICMLIGMVQVVPRAKAAATLVAGTSTTFLVHGRYNGGNEEEFHITVDYTKFSYDGSPHQPTISSIENKTASSGDYSSFYLQNVNAISAGTHTTAVKDPSGNWSFRETDVIEFEITRRNVSEISVDRGKGTVVSYTGGVVYPQKKDLVVTASTNGTSITLAADQYELSEGASAVGTSASCKVTLNDPNYSSSPTTSCNYVIAYDLSGDVGYKASLLCTSYDFGTSHTPEIKLERVGDPGDSIVVSKNSTYTNDFSLEYYKLIKNADGTVVSREKMLSIYDAGEYEVELSPRNGSYVDLGSGKIFTGKFVGKVSVNQLIANSSTLTVTALDSTDKRVTLSDQNYKLKLNFKGAGVVVEPKEVVVEDNTKTDITKKCSITTRNADKAGKAWLIITPDPSQTNYTGSYEIEYYIVSDIYVQSFRFAGMSANQDHIIYDGEVHELATGADGCVVKNGADIQLEQGANRDYTITYEYTDDDVNWDIATETEKASVGHKRIVINGCGNIYSGVTAYKEYWIDPVNIDIQEYRDKCSVELDKSEFYYNGNAIKPSFTFKYNGAEIGTSADPKNQFTYEITNNIEAGSNATITIKMSNLNFKGTYTKTFTIKKLPITSAVVTGSCIYDGKEKAPIIKIEDAGKGIDYTLNQNAVIKDYEVLGYRKQGATEWSTSKPIDAGDYQMQVNIVNSNISCPSGTTIPFDYTIEKCNIDSLRIYIDENDAPGGEMEWTGGVTNPKVVVPSIMTADDYELRYENNNIVTNASITVDCDAKNSKNFTGTKVLHYTILPRELKQSNSDFTLTTKVTGILPGAGYDIALKLTDNARKPDQRELIYGTDYEIEQVRIYNDSTKEWDDVLGPYSSPITGLNQAGKYEITIKGIGSYVGTVTTLTTCGKDISAYRAYINMVSESSVIFNGSDQIPTSFSLYDANDKPVSGIQYDSNVSNTDFQIDYERTDGGIPINTATGKIYVVAIGNPNRGYFGRTSRVDKLYSYYTITAPIWSHGQFEIIVATDGGIKYMPENATKIPYITVKFNGVTLTKDADYQLRYNEADLKTAGDKVIYVDGIGNYDNQSNKGWPAEYVVEKVNVSSPEAIKIITQPSKYTDVETGSITLKHNNYVLQEGKDKDYTKSIQPQNGKKVVKEGDKYYVYYLIKGTDVNYTGEVQVKVQVNIVDLSSSLANFADSAETAAVGDFYVKWDQSELLIKDAKLPEVNRTPVTPSAFSIVYKQSETEEIVLKKGEDYIIQPDGYGSNNTAGNVASNYVTIEGINGYTNIRQLKFTLYTQMKDVQTTNTSLITPGAIITKTEWKKVYEKDGEAGLLKLEPLSFDEQVNVDPNEYTLDWESTFDPADPKVGDCTVRVIGKQGPAHYYYGSTSIRFRIVDGIENAKIKVGTDDTVTYQGKDNPVFVTQSGIGIEVIPEDGGKPLVYGTDFEITGYIGNDSIGTATVFLKGIGKYSGTAQHTFMVTYPIKLLVPYMLNPETGEWVNCKEQTPKFKYTGNPIEPQIRLYCPLDKPENGDYTQIDPIHPTMYDASSYLTNTNAGTGFVVVKGKPYFVDGTADPQTNIAFTIGVASICPPSVSTGSTVTYESDTYGDVEHIVAEYMGENYTVDDLGIKLRDRTTELKEGVDYYVNYDGDRLNVSDPTNLPMITFSGTGNYDENSKYAIKFRIAEKSLTDTSISVSSSAMTYTDTDLEQSLIDHMNITLRTPRAREIKLACGTDYEILGYYTDVQCSRSVTAAVGVPSAGGDYYLPSAQGTYYAKIKGINNFKDTRVVKIEIGQRDLTGDIKINFVSSSESDCEIDLYGQPDCTYDNEPHCPAVEVLYGINNIRLREELDYTVNYSDNVNAGTAATVTVTMLPGSNYTGSATKTFTIKPKDITGADMAFKDTDGNVFQNEQSHEWTQNPVQPGISVYDKSLNAALTQGVTDGTAGDYLVNYEDDNDDDSTQRNAGQVTMTVKGQGNYTGEKVFTYYIGEDISQCRTLVNGRDSVSVEYNGLVLIPTASSITVIAGGSTDLTDANGEKRYDIAYYKGGFEKTDVVTRDQIVDAATYYVAVVGVPSKGTYAKSSESNSCKFTINPRSIAPSYILVSGYDGTYYYTGQQICPKGIAVEDTDLPVSLDENDPQRRTVKLINGIDYDLTYANNTSAGKASIIVSGKGNYAGSRVAYFNIISSNADGNNTWDGSSEGTGSISNGSTTIAASDIILGYDNSVYNCMMYNGYERIPTVNIAGISNSDFIVTASNNVQPGVATLTITGRGTNFTGTIIKNYKIKADLSTYGTISRIDDQVYTGSQITPHVTVTCGRNVLNQGSDFTVSYMNNTNVGRATVMATATSDSYYIGTATGSFNISNTAVGMEITGYASTYTYTGNAISPDVVVTMNGRILTRGTDYTVTYSNNTNVGTATMTINGIGSFSGTKTINYTIEAKNIENCLTTAVTNYQYTGSTYTPNVTVTDSANGKTLVAGTDYTITYSNNTNPGTALITVTALSNNYTGTKVIPFKITSASVSGLRTSTIKNNSIKLAWTAQDYADGYQICNSSNRVVATTNKNSYTVKGLTSCTTYKFKVRSYVENADGSISYGGFSTAVSAKTLLNTPTLKATSKSKGKVTLTWTKVAKATGYEIYYSTKKNGVYTRLKTISKSSSRKYVDSGLASGEKYYYTIRAYRTSNGVKTYSNYNTIKAVKVK